MFTWHPISEDPPRTGYYLLAHYGTMTAHNFWRGHDKKWIGLVKYGWVQNAQGGDPLAFRPTHWMFVPFPYCEVENGKQK